MHIFGEDTNKPTKKQSLRALIFFKQPNFIKQLIVKQFINDKNGLTCRVKNQTPPESIFRTIGSSTPFTISSFRRCSPLNQWQRSAP